MTKYVTKDGGLRDTYESGMMREPQIGRIRWTLAFDGPLLKRYAELMTRGAEKYEDRNWMKASSREELDRFRDSAARHFMQWLAGERDEDHAAAVVFNINAAEYVEERLNEGRRLQ